jgi:predicted SAM-dependent methyltransferase
MQGHKPKGPGLLYRMYIAAKPTECANVAILDKHTWEHFHKIMGHVNVATLKRLKIGPEYGISIDLTSEDNFQCETYIHTKQHVEPFPNQATHTLDKLKIGKIVVCDVWSPVQVKSVHGYQYSMTFTDLAV